MHFAPQRVERSSADVRETALGSDITNRRRSMPEYVADLCSQIGERLDLSVPEMLLSRPEFDTKHWRSIRFIEIP